MSYDRHKMEIHDYDDGWKHAMWIINSLLTDSQLDVRFPATIEPSRPTLREWLADVRES